MPQMPKARNLGFGLGPVRIWPHVSSWLLHHPNPAGDLIQDATQVRLAVMSQRLTMDDYRGPFDRGHHLGMVSRRALAGRGREYHQSSERH